ncbi:hypothetical protein ACTXG7_08125 [Mycolicibacterium sp. Dal123E01]|uniref:hypothetical protein n=1 Tax=Mycolicibacterium sp. Dal123E01 TaxID=3457578 RepID=UPI00403EE436
MIRHIPHFIMGTQQIMENVDFVVDPFCGSGTILVEALRRHHESYGFDQNPVAALAARVKTTPCMPDAMADVLDCVMRAAKKSRKQAPYPSYLEKWYNAEAISVLARLTQVKTQYTSNDTCDYIDMCIALLARKVSTADPRIPVPVRQKNPRSPSTEEIWQSFETIGKVLSTRIERLQAAYPVPIVRCCDSKSRAAYTLIPEVGNGLVFTSPPYGASQKYIRSTSLESGWLGFSSDFGTKHLERLSIGREHVPRMGEIEPPTLPFSTSLKKDIAKISNMDKQRGRIYEHYFTDMTNAFHSISSHASLNTIVLVVGDNVAAGYSIQTSRHLAAIVQSLGYRDVLSLRDPIRGRTLLTRRNNGVQPTSAEYIKVFQR